MKSQKFELGPETPREAFVALYLLPPSFPLPLEHIIPQNPFLDLRRNPAFAASKNRLRSPSLFGNRGQHRAKILTALFDVCLPRVPKKSLKGWIWRSASLTTLTAFRPRIWVRFKTWGRRTKWRSSFASKPRRKGHPQKNTRPTGPPAASPNFCRDSTMKLAAPRNSPMVSGKSLAWGGSTEGICFDTPHQPPPPPAFWAHKSKGEMEVPNARVLRRVPQLKPE